MNIDNLKTVYPALMAANVTPLLWGPPGIGKTQVVRQLAQEHGYNFIYLTFASIEDMGDLVGLQDRVYNSEGVAVSTRHLQPDWFPTTPKNIIFLDEFNRANKSIIQAMLPFILEKRLYNHILPPDTHIVLAANPPTDDMIVNDVSDRALGSRVCHITLEPTVKEFLNFAKIQNADYSMTSFIHENPEMLEPKEESYKFDNLKPNRRAWLDFISPLVKQNLPEELLFEVVKGIVGVAATTKFIQHRKSIKNNRIRYDEILDGYNAKLAERVKMFSLDMLNILNEEIVREVKTTGKLGKKQAKNLSSYMKDAPVELSYNFIRNLFLLGLKDVNDTIGEDKDLNELFKNKLDTIKDRK